MTGLMGALNSTIARIVLLIRLRRGLSYWLAPHRLSVSVEGFSQAVEGIKSDYVGKELSEIEVWMRDGKSSIEGEERIRNILLGRYPDLSAAIQA